MAITEKDKQFVRKTALETFGHHAFKTGVYPADEELNRRLLEETTELPKNLTLNQLKRIFDEKKFEASQAYLKKFYGAYGFEKLRRMQSASKFKTALEIPRFCDIARRLESKFDEGKLPEFAPPTEINIQ